MTDEEVFNYVKAAAAALGLTLDEAQQQRVAVHLARTAGLARQLDATALGPADEPAEVYCPAPFPSPLGDRHLP